MSRLSTTVNHASALSFRRSRRAMVVVSSLAMLVSGPLIVLAGGGRAYADSMTPGGYLWGADSVSIASSLLAGVQTDYGATPAFWGQYIADCTGSCGSPITPAEIQGDFNDGLNLMLLVGDTTDDTTSATGTADATNVVSVAEADGAPKGAAIFRDIEAGSSVDANFLTAWYNTVLSAGYVPGFYGNPSDQFGTAYCQAVSQQSSVANAELYSSEPEPSSYDNTGPGQAPTWGPLLPSCATNVVAWQYSEGDNGGIDLDEAVQDIPLWGPNGLTGPPPPSTTFTTAFQGAGNENLWGYSSSSGLGTDFDLQMEAGTSPSIARLGTNHYVIAYASATGNVLHVYDTSTKTNTSYGDGLVTGSNPSIAALSSTQYMVAFSAAGSNSLYILNSSTGIATNYSDQVAPGSSPSTTALSSSRYVVAFPGAGSHALYVYDSSTGLITDDSDQVAPGSSAAAEGLSSTRYVVAFPGAGSRVLYVFDSSTGHATDDSDGVASGTTPSAIAVSSSHYVVAFSGAGSSLLYVFDSVSGIATDTLDGLEPGTSPSATTFSSGSYEVSFAAAGSDDLWNYQSSSNIGYSTRLGLEPGSNPSASS